MIFRILIFYSIYFVASSYFEQNWDLYKNNFDFSSADIKANFNEDAYTLEIELFKSFNNDIILQNKIESKYEDLVWTTIGVPKLKTTKSFTNFSIGMNGFSLINHFFPRNIDDLIKLINKKYRIHENYCKVIPLIPNSIECKLLFKSNKDVSIYGRAFVINGDFEINFYAPENSKQRNLFDMEINKTKQNVKIDCNFSWFAGKVLDAKKFVLTPQMSEKIGIIDKLFGKSDEIYITPNQFKFLSFKIYEDLNIFHDYDMTLDDVEKFAEDFTKKLNLTFKRVDFDQVITNLSKFNLNENIKLNDIKSDMSKLYKISRKNSKESIDFNAEEYDKFSKKYEKLKGSVFGHKEVLSGFDRVQNDKFVIGWSRKADSIVPISIQVVKINKKSFKSNITFDEITKINKEVYFKRNFIIKDWSD